MEELLVRAVVLGDGLGAFRHGMLGQFTGQDETDGRLHLAGGDGVLLGVASQASSLISDLVEHIVDKGVHDLKEKECEKKRAKQNSIPHRHGLVGDTSLWVHLLQHTVDKG